MHRSSSRAALLVLTLLVSLPVWTQGADDPPISRSEQPVGGQANHALGIETKRIIQEVLNHGQAFANLRELTAIGHRLSGSPGNAKAVRWAAGKMKSYHVDRVWLQPVSVPHWERGDIERAEMLLDSGRVSLRVTALGNSPGTPPGGVTAPVVEVKSLKEVERLGLSLKGKIVFYNRPMNPALKNTFEAYGQAADQRGRGPATAAKYGAVAAVVRSLTTLANDDHPHTGATLFQDPRHSGTEKAIPAAALSAHAANELSHALRKDPALKLKLVLSARTLPDVTSYNVIGEIRGRQSPEKNEIVLIGAHLDSWDLATGAHDDGAGVTHALEVLRALKALNLRPKRTVRVVLFAAEEFGFFGGREYAKQALRSKKHHVAGIETDTGGFAPVGFMGGGKHPEVIRRVQSWVPYLRPLHVDTFTPGRAESEVQQLQKHGMVAFDLMTDSTHYFDVHHSALDRLEAVNKSDLIAGSAALTVFAYLLAEEGVPSR